RVLCLLLPAPRSRCAPRLAARRLRRRARPGRSTAGYSPVTRWLFTAISLSVVMMIVSVIVAHRARADLRARRFFELSQDMLSTMDTEGRCVEANAAWQRTLGYAPSELEGRPLLELTHPEDHE